MDTKATFPFLDAQYFITFTGADKGNIFCHSATHLNNVLCDLFPNPGDADHAALANPHLWAGDNNGFPYFVEREILTAETGHQTTVRIYRVMELES